MVAWASDVPARYQNRDALGFAARETFVATPAASFLSHRDHTCDIHGMRSEALRASGMVRSSRCRAVAENEEYADAE